MAARLVPLAWAGIIVIVSLTVRVVFPDCTVRVDTMEDTLFILVTTFLILLFVTIMV
jgi:hypothetical protein